MERIYKIVKIPAFILLLLFLSCKKEEIIENQPPSEKEALPLVKKADLNEINPDLFAEEEWYVPYYLSHFATVANSVSDTENNYGFFNLSVWRGTANHHTYNARIMEGILSLVWFYTKERPWNPYYNDPALKARIEAAFTFWCNMQKADGRFTEYSPTGSGMAATPFATKFIGRAIWLLNRGPNIDKNIFERSRIALRKALDLGLTSNQFWGHGKSFTNQYANFWGGAMMYLDCWPDAEINNLLKNRLEQSMQEFQSPAGFFYERGSTDWGYNLSTHHSDLLVAWDYARGKEFHDEIIEKVNRWYDWFSYNAVKEPGSQCYYLNRGIEARQQKGYYLVDGVNDPASERWVPQAEYVPMARAFEITGKELLSSQQEKYQAMREKYPAVNELKVGSFSAFSPYAFLHDGMVTWFPSDAQKNEAIAMLPYLKSDNFIHVRSDKYRSRSTYSYIRKPTYYAIFNSGYIATEQQRYGLGLIWNPVLGTIFQSQSKTNVAAYGTKAENTEAVYEASDITSSYKLDGTIWTPGEGIHNPEGGLFEVSYPLDSKGEKTILFDNDKLIVRIKHKGKFSEILPLLKSSSDDLTWDTNQINLQNTKGLMTIKFKNSKGVNQSLFKANLDKKKCHVFKVTATDELEYEIYFQ